MCMLTSLTRDVTNEYVWFPPFTWYIFMCVILVAFTWRPIHSWERSYMHMQTCVHLSEILKLNIWPWTWGITCSLFFCQKHSWHNFLSHSAGTLLTHTSFTCIYRVKVCLQTVNQKCIQVPGISLRVGVRSSAAAASWGGSGIWFGFLPDAYLWRFSCTLPTGRRPRGRPIIQWRDYISLTLQRIRIPPQEELEKHCWWGTDCHLLLWKFILR